MLCAHVLAIVFTVSSHIAYTQAKAVFAHFIIGNSAGSTYDDWVDDIQKAQTAHIDGFALNIAPGDSYTDTSLNNAYKAADASGNFTLFLSFDYLSSSPWAASEVIRYVNTYKDRPSQYRYNGQPLVSTFEGVANVADWASIKATTGCFFIPAWTSLQGNFPTDKVDGAFAWDAWPDGPADKNQTSDQAWKKILGDKPYMMSVSPWFYTNIPEWQKNWLWRGDDLWHDRWQQVIEFQPELVEIITWNDYGESHYIGPIRPTGIPKGAQTYVNDMPHDSWRDLLPHYIDAYKSANTTTHAIDQEKLVFWYRVNPAQSGSTGGTTGNHEPQNTAIYDPKLLAQDKVFLSVLVASPADVNVQIGGNAVTTLKAVTSGINHFSVPFNGQVGNVTFTVSRNGESVVKAAGPAITDACAGGLVNWNAYVGGSS